MRRRGPGVLEGARHIEHENDERRRWILAHIRPEEVAHVGERGPEPGDYPGEAHAHTAGGHHQLLEEAGSLR